MQKIPDQVQAHSGTVSAVVFRGEQIVTAGTDKMIKVWGWKQGQQGNYASPSGVLALCQGAGGNLFSGEMDGTLRLWRFSLESVGSVFGQQGSAVTTIAALGNVLLSGSQQGTLFLWDEKGAKKTLVGHAASIHALLFKNPQMAISGSSDNTIKIWDLQKECCQHSLNAHGGKVTALVLHPNGEQFFSGSEDATVKLWDLRKTEFCIGTLRLQQGPIRCLSLPQSGSHLIVGGDSVQVIDLRNLQTTSTVRSSPPSCMAMQGNRLAVGTMLGGLNFDELSNLTASLNESPRLPGAWKTVYRDQGVEPGRIFLFKAQEGPVSHLAFHSPYVLTAGADGKVAVHAVSVESAVVEERCVLPHQSAVVALGFLPNQKWIYTATAQKLFLWDPERGGKPVEEYTVTTIGNISAVASKGSLVVLGTERGLLHIYHAHAKKGRCLQESLLKKFKSHPPIVGVDVYEDEVFALNQKGKLYIWSMHSNEHTSHTLCEGISSAKGLFFSYLPEKETLVLACKDKILHFKRESGKWHALKDTNANNACCYSLKAGGILAGGGQDQMSLWDLVQEKAIETGKKICQPLAATASSRALSALTFCPMRNLYAYGDDKGFVTISGMDLPQARPDIDVVIPLIRKDQIAHLEMIKGASGAFGQIYKGTWNRMTVAFKELVSLLGKSLEQQRRDFAQEVQVMWELRGHPQFTTLYGYCLEPLALVMLFEEGGTLKNRLESSAVLSIPQRFLFALDVVYAIAELHRRNAIHADLKSENVLLDKQGRAKLADFGQTDISSYSGAHSIEQQGDLFWQAPEVIKQIITPSTTKKRIVYTKAADIYSLGLLFFQIFTRKVPVDQATKAIEIITGKRPNLDALPDSLQAIKTLIQECWQGDFQKRPTIDEVRQKLEIFKREHLGGELCSTELLSSIKEDFL